MARAIDLELLQLLEDKLGKEKARKVAQAIELWQKNLHFKKSLS